MSIQNNTSVELCYLSDTPGNILDSYHWILYMIFFFSSLGLYIWLVNKIRHIHINKYTQKLSYILVELWCAFVLEPLSLPPVCVFCFWKKKKKKKYTQKLPYLNKSICNCKLYQLIRAFFLVLHPINEPNIKNSSLFIYLFFFFFNEPSLNLSPNNILYSSFAHFLIK